MSITQPDEQVNEFDLETLSLLPFITMLTPTATFSIEMATNYKTAVFDVKINRTAEGSSFYNG